MQRWSWWRWGVNLIRIEIVTVNCETCNSEVFVDIWDYQGQNEENSNTNEPGENP